MWRLLTPEQQSESASKSEKLWRRWNMVKFAFGSGWGRASIPRTGRSGLRKISISSLFNSSKSPGKIWTWNTAICNQQCKVKYGGHSVPDHACSTEGASAWTYMNGHDSWRALEQNFMKYFITYLYAKELNWALVHKHISSHQRLDPSKSQG